VESLKEEFASQVVKQNPELMASIHEMFESQHQEYLMYSSVYDPTAPVALSDSVAFEPPPLLGKGDGYSQESALKDSMHPS